MDVSLTR